MVQLVNEFVEFIEEVLLFAFQVLELLEFDFIFPFHIAETANNLFDLPLTLFKF